MSDYYATELDRLRTEIAASKARETADSEQIAGLLRDLEGIPRIQELMAELAASERVAARLEEQQAAATELARGLERERNRRAAEAWHWESIARELEAEMGAIKATLDDADVDHEGTTKRRIGRVLECWAKTRQIAITNTMRLRETESRLDEAQASCAAMRKVLEAFAIKEAQDASAD